uniref:Uncharacterized protein n=1 Tax=viral metagenome TaxID=1070528 RepID=A0A6C0K721_9ZZZZ
MNDEYTGDTHPLVANDEEYNLDLIISFIEKHPEDADKWLDHLKPIFETETLWKTHRGERLSEEELENQVQRHYIEENNRSENDDNMITNEFGCLRCNKRWDSTTEHPTMTLLCGHKMHTVCYLMGQYYDDTARCSHPGCDHNPWDIIRKISRRRDRVREETRNTLTEIILNKQSFKNDLRTYKECIKEYIKQASKIQKNINSIKDDTIKKHILSIRIIHDDLNNNIKRVRNSELMKNTKTALRNFRRVSNMFYRKYHLSMRDMIRRKIIRNMNWKNRSVLERHNNILTMRYYRFGIRILPGKSSWSKYMDDHSDFEDRSLDGPVPENEYVDGEEVEE